MKPSKKIWRGLSAESKRAWTMLYKDFVCELSYPPESKTFHASRAAREAIAHNHALLAVWALGDKPGKTGKGEPT